jgi:hypothetical protein
LEDVLTRQQQVLQQRMRQVRRCWTSEDLLRTAMQQRYQQLHLASELYHVASEGGADDKGPTWQHAQQQPQPPLAKGRGGWVLAAVCPADSCRDPAPAPAAAVAASQQEFDRRCQQHSSPLGQAAATAAAAACPPAAPGQQQRSLLTQQLDMRGVRLVEPTGASDSSSSLRRLLSDSNSDSLSDLSTGSEAEGEELVGAGLASPVCQLDARQLPCQ